MVELIEFLVTPSKEEIEFSKSITQNESEFEHVLEWDPLIEVLGDAWEELMAAARARAPASLTNDTRTFRVLGLFSVTYRESNDPEGSFIPVLTFQSVITDVDLQGLVLIKGHQPWAVFG